MNVFRVVKFITNLNIDIDLFLEDVAFSVEVLHTMNQAVAVDHAFARRIGHAGGTHVVVGTFHVGRPAHVVDARTQGDLGDLLVFQLARQQLEGGVDRVLDPLVEPPVDLSTAHAQSIDIIEIGRAHV